MVGSVDNGPSQLSVCGQTHEKQTIRRHWIFTCLYEASVRSVDNIATDSNLLFNGISLIQSSDQTRVLAYRLIFLTHTFLGKFRKDGTKVVTRIKKVSGDTALFLQELRAVLKLPQPANGLAAYDSIRIRTGGTIEINGHRSRDVQEWLTGLGF